MTTGVPFLSAQAQTATRLEASHDFKLAGDSLDQVLGNLGRQSGAVISVDASLTAGMRSQGLAGRYTTMQALQRVLTGTGLEPVRDTVGEYTLRRQTPSVGATSTTTLHEVSVVGTRQNPSALPEAYAGGMTARGARAGVLGNQDVMDIPFSMTSYTESFIRGRSAKTIADTVAFDPSVMVSQTGGMVDSYSIRGFPIAEGNVGEIAFNGVYGIAPNYRAFTPYIERVEVLKGATGLLYGVSPDGGVGGVINVVPKRATDQPITRLSTSFEERSVGGLQLDVGRRFGEQQEWGVRVNGSHEQGKTAVDNQRREISVGALGLDYRGDKLSVSLDLINQYEDWDAPSRVFSIGTGMAVPDAPNGRSNPAQTWGWSTLKDRSALVDLEYRVNDQVTVFGNLGHGYSKVDRLFDQQMVFSNSAGDFTSTPRYGIFEVKRDTASAGARLGFTTGAIRHRATIQATTLDVTNYQNSTDGRRFSSNLYAPLRLPAQDVAAPGSVPRVAKSQLDSLALSDTLSILNDRVQIIAGARYVQIDADNWDRITGARTSTYQDKAWTPALGAIYRTTSSTMLYASYIEGLSRGDVAPQTARNAGEMLSPYKSKQYELGFKADFDSVMATASLFQIVKPSAFIENGVFGQSGEQRNRGLELGLQGEATKGVRLHGGITWLNAELTQTADPALRGNQPVGVPRWHTTLGAEWDLPWVPGVTLTSGLIYSGKQYVNQQNSASLSSWTRVDVGARYATNIHGNDVTFQLDLKNAFDQAYWSGVSQWGAFALGSPRTLSLSASVAF
ncbi:TonB-dependent receptor [Pigmentiphaga aceris]|uniref:TonB-dependent receptor n=2 Tax=Pigmentiphaga aceris TaxID=1940612 RepID=A0A5C0B642_9BURK|nr:TonB-dependent receptor [Pigmentiphaga aceris]